MSANQYYYLDANKNIRGPFTAEHMKALVIAGTINMQTMVAIAGDDNWKPLETQEWVKDGQVQTEEGQGPTFTAGVGGVDPGACSYCGHEITGWSVPTHCPNCDKQLAPVKDSIGSNMALGFRRLFSVRGRSTRKEFWSMMLAGFIINVIIYVGLMIAGVAYLVRFAQAYPEMDADDIVLALAGDIPAVLVGFVVLSMVVAIPYYFIMSRRLHDIGHSAIWVVLALLANVGYNAVYCTGVVEQLEATLADVPPYTEHVSRVTEQAIDELGLTEEQLAQENFDVDVAVHGNRAIIKATADDKTVTKYVKIPAKLDENSIEQRLNLPYPMDSLPGIACIVLQLASTILGLFLFVVAFIDSKRGPNQYGPSLKYPRG